MRTPRCITLLSSTLLAALSIGAEATLAADCSPTADEVNAKCYQTLQAAVDAALASDRPLVLPKGTYPINVPLIIDYAAHGNTGFELISRGAVIDATAVTSGPALEIVCSGGSPSHPKGCFYFHQEGTLFVNGASPGYAVQFGNADFSDAHNSIKVDHLVVNNRGASGVQLNYVLNAEIFVVADAAGAGAGIALEQVQFSTIRGAGSATTGAAIAIENGYTFSDTLELLDLEASRVCWRFTSNNIARMANLAAYMDCPTLVETTHEAWDGWSTSGGLGGVYGGAVQTIITWLD